MNVAGELRLFPGRAGATIEGGRPELASRVALGRPAALVPALLGALYTLCPLPHRLAAQAALAAAAGRPFAAGPAARRALQAATAKEQVLRIAHDWPRQWPRLDEAAAAEGQRLLLDSPLWQPRLAVEQQLQALPAWWSGRGLPAAEALLRRMRPHAEPLATPEAPLRVLDDPTAQLPPLAARMAEAPAFCTWPDWQGRPRDSGPWSRANGPAPAANAWQRLQSRLADLHRLASPEGEFWLAQGALSPAAGEGLAWVEMARGLLLHWVRLEPGHDPATRRVAAYRVLAPTEWNFHPQGGLARALAALDGRDGESQARALALAYDPCVNFSVQGAAMAGGDA